MENIDIRFQGQGKQDLFVYTVLKGKHNGYFVEIGSAVPDHDNNSYILEKNLNWKGFMIEYREEFRNNYSIIRPNSIHFIKDATKIDYLSEFNKHNFPTNIDYLQIDLEVENRSTLDILEIYDSKIFEKYKFATITFEHDFYRGNFFNTKEKSRLIFEKWGYHRVFTDVRMDDVNVGSWEDWYVHPSLVDMNLINRITKNNSMDYKEIINILSNECDKMK
jgi:hypothetical protein